MPKQTNRTIKSEMQTELLLLTGEHRLNSFYLLNQVPPPRSDVEGISTTEARCVFTV